MPHALGITHNFESVAILAQTIVAQPRICDPAQKTHGLSYSWQTLHMTQLLPAMGVLSKLYLTDYDEPSQPGPADHHLGLCHSCPVFHLCDTHNTRRLCRQARP